MPASMISAPSGGAPKVIGNSMAMVAIGPMPGSTPISVTSITPMKQKPRLIGVPAAPNPVARFANMSISASPDRDRLAEEIDEQDDTRRRQCDGKHKALKPAHVARRETGDQCGRCDRGREPEPLDHE